MRSFVRAATLAALLALAAAAARRTDQDFEFDDDTDAAVAAAAPGGSGAHSRRPSRYVYDPHNSLCRSLVCKKREVCVLRDAFTALCATKKDILRRGDVIVAASSSGGAWEGERDSGQAERDDNDDDVFYDTAVHDTDVDPDLDADDAKRYFVGYYVRYASTSTILTSNIFAGSEGCALDKMANRLLDWFSVLMDEAGATAPPADGFPRDCKPEVRWMFAHLDTDGDGLLSAANLYALRHDERERCLRPFLASCAGAGGGAGAGAGGGAGLARAEWCACLRRAARPCLALARAHAGAGGGGYVPACDARGFYRPRQCHAALAVCWCVDPHGQELPGSRTKGAPACPGEKSMADVEGGEEGEASEAGEEGEAGAQGAPDDDEDGAGSGDAELHF
ncbi:unnamed protein product [Spodoptera littoralis]|uniref:Thyroglobulin type-1 domain-containing protein n=1 Tax=Spodoptera littoralis TaxID=7109 RepID=A0A9P0N6Y7_SPOLI|nr:unnamed protein product [Spodoptera littoralis]CAH1647320.1 unnamed protein product [Spodoptera littoralis]